MLLDGDAQFRSDALEHPLLSPAKCVPNDIAIGGDLRLLIISGSNMSGKSTLLRAIGLNTVLAWAGSPVAAISTDRLSALRWSLAARDRFPAGQPLRFFAEITRLRQIVDLTKLSRPSFFSSMNCSAEQIHTTAASALPPSCGISFQPAPSDSSQLTIWHRLRLNRT